MKASNMLVGNVTIKQHQKEILLSTKGQYMKESNFLVDNVTIKQQQKKVLLNTKGQYMKESSILVGNATIKQLQREVLQGTIGLHIKANKHSKLLETSGRLAVLGLDKVMFSLHQVFFIWSGE